jgi:hypothetical protein
LEYIDVSWISKELLKPLISLSNLKSMNTSIGIIEKNVYLGLTIKDWYKKYVKGFSLDLKYSKIDSIQDLTDNYSDDKPLVLKNLIHGYINSDFENYFDGTKIKRLYLHDTGIKSFKWIENIFPNLEYIDVREIPNQYLEWLLELLKLGKLNKMRISGKDAKWWQNPIEGTENIKEYIEKFIK